jgi:hypothetical protein
MPRPAGALPRIHRCSCSSFTSVAAEAGRNKPRVAGGLPESRRAVQIRHVGSNGGPEALEATTLPLPWDELGDHDVMLQVTWLQRRGPLCPCSPPTC